MSWFKVRILTTDEKDAHKWRDLIEGAKCADIFFTLEYAMLFEGTEGKTREAFGGEANLFAYGDDHNYILLPFFKRKISEASVEWRIPPDFKDYVDIVSPYGYSGPLACITDKKLEEGLWKEFLEEFHVYCAQERIAAEFVRLHPFLKNHLYYEKFFNGDLKKSGKIVYIDLGQDMSQIRKGMDKGNKSSLSKARRNGLEIIRSKSKEAKDAFCSLYSETMKRNKAHEPYFFPENFFSALFSLLDRNTELFCARYKDRIIAASVFLFKNNYCHYYLSGANAEFLHLCPNNLIICEALIWAKGQGFKTFNLGGGYKANDTLFRFKSSFSPSSIDFYTYGRIHQEEAYNALSLAREAVRPAGSLREAKQEYFPVYRR